MGIVLLLLLKITVGAEPVLNEEGVIISQKNKEEQISACEDNAGADVIDEMTEERIKIKFYAIGEMLFEREAIAGDLVLEPLCDAPVGFSHTGWYFDRELEERCYFDEPFYSDTELFASFTLNPPEFRISSKSVTYNMGRHLFGVDSVYHPLEEQGTYSYEWYRDGEYFSTGEKISLRDARDSGEYSVKINFIYGQHIASVTTPYVKITIDKASVEIPEISPKEFSGELIIPDIPRSTLYTCDFSGKVNAGSYPVVLTLSDPDNYRWQGKEEESVSVNFEILRAKNYFVQKPNAFDVYTLAENTFSAIPRFGELTVSYLDKSGSAVLSGLPYTAGEYFAVFSVAETDDYEGISSGPLAFKILEDEVLGISVSTEPEKKSYTAFELFNPKGLSVLVTYSSGRSEIIGAQNLTFSYQSADNLRFGDGAVKASYLGKSVFVPITVNKAEYDITELAFEDVKFEYTGAFISPAFSGLLPEGKDGISLSARVEGGGVNVGEYEIKLVFKSESRNYNTPAPLFAKLTVEKKKTVLVWEDTEFVYDGKRHCPRAYFNDVFGVPTEINVIGEAYTAGDNYKAVAEEVNNYEFDNPSVYFRVKKADYDLTNVKWSEGSFIYDGTEHTVTVSGLPIGVSVGGYANNSFKNAGNYAAEVSLVYDTDNYNPPKIPAFYWSISRAEYVLSGFDFENSEEVFDGKIHYPRLSGILPMGFDGITLGCKFSTGACHVSDGTVSVEISFFTESKNYNAPKSIIRTVKILPKPILVNWENKVFTYNGKTQAPACHTSECSVTVTGAAADAGEYIARAFSDNPDYYITNNELFFTVLKAENSFVLEPFAENIFEGCSPVFGGKAHFGELVFRIFKDALLEEEVEEASAPGVYYVTASVPESKNYLAITSLPISFKVIEVVAIGIDIIPNRTQFTAFETVKKEDFLAFLLYNDGTRTAISGEELTVVYERAESFRAADESVVFTYGEFSSELAVVVGLAAFDMSELVWLGLENIYDGEEKRAVLAGLPKEITLLRIEGGVGVNAGEYPAHAVFEYDRENYEAPSIPDVVLKIERAKLPLPYFAPVVYDGGFHKPDSALNNFTINTSESFRNSGEYEISVSLTDSTNYEFVDGSTQAVCTFNILPRRIKTDASEIKLYLGQKYKTPSFNIKGAVDGDRLELHYTLKDNSVIVSTDNPNYAIYEEIPIVRSLLPSPEARVVILIVFLFIALFVLFLVILQRKKHKLAIALLGIKRNREEKKTEHISIKEADADEFITKESVPEKEDCDEIQLPDFAVPMNPERADALISNSLAKELISDEEECILTGGKRKGIINVDTLSENFSAGERVDVNILKSKSLVPYDTAYIKVLARGIIDKPLYVYANDFSTTAVKMLALTGGKAIKVSTIKLKNEEQNIN